MKIHEYQAKALLKPYGVAVPKSIPVFSAGEAAGAAKKLIDETGTEVLVVKSQIHAGGRGKGTINDNPDQKGVVVCTKAAEVRHAAEGLLGKTLVTIQTGPEGKTVNKVFVEAGCDIARELYLGIVLDRATAKPVLITPGCNFPEVAKAGAGLCVSPEPGPLQEALRTLLDMSESERTEMGRRGRKLVEKNYTWDIAARKMITVYQCILAGKDIPLHPAPAAVKASDVDE